MDQISYEGSIFAYFIKTGKTTCKVFRSLLRCEDFRRLDYTV